MSASLATVYTTAHNQGISLGVMVIPHHAPHSRAHRFTKTPANKSQAGGQPSDSLVSTLVLGFLPLAMLHR